jgi:hypothetical protein
MIVPFKTNEKADEIMKFFQDHPMPVADNSINQGIEQIRMRERIKARYEETVEAHIHEILSQ